MRLTHLGYFLPGVRAPDLNLSFRPARPPPLQCLFWSNIESLLRISVSSCDLLKLHPLQRKREDISKQDPSRDMVSNETSASLTSA